MHRRQAIALFIVSLWIGWTLFMWFAATRSFRTATRMWQKPQPELAQLLKPLGENASLTVLRRFAGEVNATDFRAYGLAQVILGALLLLLLLWQRPRDNTALALVGVMLVLVFILALFIAPEIASLGRTLDFNPSPDRMAQFWTLHGAYTGLDGVKLLAGVVLAARWIWKA
ncbi:MAG: hypothetical protein ACRD19_02425 [Terriglobia bacterium]